jgi:hypothetical protein
MTESKGVDRGKTGGGKKPGAGCKPPNRMMPTMAPIKSSERSQSPNGPMESPPRGQ